MSDVQQAPQKVVTRGLDPRAYPSGRPDGVWAPLRVDARVEPAHDGIFAAQGGARAAQDKNLEDQHAPQKVVTRGLDPRAYPSGRPDGVWAPLRVDARVEPAHDGIFAAHDDAFASRDGTFAAHDGGEA